MKKVLVIALFLSAIFSSTAQIELAVKSLELESIDKFKGWKLLDAERNVEQGTYHLIFGQSICDATRSAWTGTTTYKGLKWNIDNVVLNSNFEYVRTDSKSYDSSEEAILNNQFVFGRKYTPRALKLVGGAGVLEPLDNSFMFTTIVTPAVTFTGFKINTSFITCSPIVNDTKYNGTLCGEEPVFDLVSNEDAKEEKGQRWIPSYSNPIPNGGVILFNTVGVIKEEKNYYVLRKYDDTAQVIKEQTFTFDNQSLITTKKVEKQPGVFDYYLIVTP